MWLSGRSWDPWRALFEERGYQTESLLWPGEHGASPADAGTGFVEIADAARLRLRDAPEGVVVVGVGVAGLVAEKLLADGLVAAAVAIAPPRLTAVMLNPEHAPGASSMFSSFWRPSNIDSVVELAPDEFAEFFGTHIDRPESDELCRLFAIPSPARPLFQVRGVEYIHSHFIRDDVLGGGRGPLLFVTTSSAATGTGAASTPEDVRERYRESAHRVDVVEFPTRGHSLTVDHGWREVAGSVLDWVDALDAHGGGPGPRG